MWGRHLQPDRALRVFENMPSTLRRTAIGPSTAMVVALVESGRVAEARSLVEDMRQKGLAPSAITYSSLIGGGGRHCAWGVWAHACVCST